MDDTKKQAYRRREEIVTYYRNKYYSLWMNSRKWNGLSYSQNYYLMKLLYANGTALIFDADADRLPSEKGLNALTSEEKNDRALIITSYASSDFNAYGQPTKPTPINIKGLSVIPDKQLDATNSVIIWAHTSHKSIEYLVNFWIDQIADVQVALDMNLFVQKVPKLFTVSPADERRVKEIASKIDAGVHQLFITADDWQAIQQVIDSGQNFIIDKLYKYKQQLEAEILNLLGIDTVQYEKNERITDEEATANDQEISLFGDAITSSLEQGAKLVREVLKYELSVEDVSKKMMKQNTPAQSGEGEQNNENNENN